MIRDILSLCGTIQKELKEFTDIAVVGLSGGADSTLVAILCVLALGAENVYGISMPASKLDAYTFNKRSSSLAQFLGIHDICCPIRESTKTTKDGIEMCFPLNGLVIGNIRAWIRMTTLYGFCEAIGVKEKRRVRVIGTGNLSEDFIGYATKYGDLGVDINPIGGLFKSEVYQLLNYFHKTGFIKNEHIDRTPSAGLWEGQTDEKELGYTYDEMEKAIRHLLYDDYMEETSKVLQFVRKRHEENDHKSFSANSIAVNKYCD